jgi:hypothetical protein
MEEAKKRHDGDIKRKRWSLGNHLFLYTLCAGLYALCVFIHQNAASGIARALRFPPRTVVALPWTCGRMLVTKNSVAWILPL